MEQGTNKPIFVVGSPRSGTSILTWCLGQHPNIIALEESGWMGDLAIDLAIYYQTGTARGEYSLLSSMDVNKAEFFAMFGKAINDLILGHRVDLERQRWRHAADPSTPSDHFEQAASPKSRWVDGTPEYSLHICGLRKLFPEALFIHIFRDVSSVVRSMLYFHHVSGRSLVANAPEAYTYWLKTVSSCFLAERAYGPSVVLRLRYSDLVSAPAAALRSVLTFLSEPYTAECLEPLAQRINSSNVPPDFKIDSCETDPSLVEQALLLCREIEENSQPREGSPAAMEEIEAAFDQQVQFVATVASEYRRIQKENQQIAARAERLSNEVKGKRAIIQHLRGRRQRHKLRRSFFRRDSDKSWNGWWNAVRESIRRRNGKS